MAIIKMNITKEKSFQEAFLEFQRTNKIKNLAKDTISYYERCRNNFAKYFDVNNHCSVINQEIYKGYIEFLYQLNIKDITVNTNLRGLKAILNYCMNEGYMEKFTMSLIKVDKKVKKEYTDSELLRLLKKPDKKDGFVTYRTWVMSNFCLGTCLRLSSILNIQIKDLYLEDKFVMIDHMKNRVSRQYPLSDYLVKILTDYLNITKGTEDDYLFCNQFGKKLSSKGAQDAFANYNHQRGVNKTSIHLYRNTFAKNWLMDEGDMLSLQKMLGHKTLAMVREYVEMYDVDVQKQYEKHNPLAKFANANKKTINF